MNKEEWINEAKNILIEVYGFGEAFAYDTAKINYEVNLEDGLLDEDYTVRELIDEELSNWAD